MESFGIELAKKTTPSEHERLNCEFLFKGGGGDGQYDQKLD